MIPKIIHLCWLSGDAYPPLIQKCIDSWKKNLPGYEIWIWDTRRFDVNSVLWTKQAFEVRKYAFAADYIRLYALYHYGGIYLDSDVLVYKSFDDLLSLPYFIGEDYNHLFEPAIIGCESHAPWIGKVLDSYKDRPFVMEDGRYDMQTLPLVFRQELMYCYSFRLINSAMDFHDADGVINLFSCFYFNGRDYVGAVRSQDSYCSHCFHGSWADPDGVTRRSLRKLFPRKLLNMYYYFRYKSVSLSHLQIPFADRADLELYKFWKSDFVSFK